MPHFLRCSTTCFSLASSARTPQCSARLRSRSRTLRCRNFEMRKWTLLHENFSMVRQAEGTNRKGGVCFVRQWRFFYAKDQFECQINNFAGDEELKIQVEEGRWTIKCCVQLGNNWFLKEGKSNFLPHLLNLFTKS